MPTYYKFDYAILNAEGEVVDSSAAGEALSFVEGDGSMIPGLEKAVVGYGAQRGSVIVLWMAAKTINPHC